MSLVVILVEDSKTIRENLISAMAELVAADVIAIAETATDAIAVIAACGETWDLLVVDLFLKEGSGLTVLRACKDRRAFI